jgi:hypothetical protein
VPFEPWLFAVAPWVPFVDAPVALVAVPLPVVLPFPFD